MSYLVKNNILKNVSITEIKYHLCILIQVWNKSQFTEEEDNIIIE